MRAAIFSYDLNESNMRLMPWRTVMEVASYMREHGHEIDLISITEKEGQIVLSEKLSAKCININVEKFSTLCRENDYDVVYFPVSIRNGIKSFPDFRNTSAKVVAYYPGGIYSWKGVRKMFQGQGLIPVKSYLLEKIVPASLLRKKLEKHGIQKMLVFTDFTKKYLVSKGWQSNNVLVSLPGHDLFEQKESDASALSSVLDNDEKFLLFSGAPAYIRGSHFVLEAFEQFAARNKDAKLIMLMRSDMHSNFSYFENQLNATRHKDRIVVIKDKLTPEQLKAFFEKARAVLLPFILIPSEIPLTFFEVLSCGTPVVSFKAGGTTEYLSDALLLSEPGEINSLAANMDKIWNDDQLRNSLSDNALKIMQQHPDWVECAKKWLEAAE